MSQKSTFPQSVLMIEPKQFEIVYGINPHMRNEDGTLKTVDKSKAVLQWNNLKSVFVDLGLRVDVIPGREGCPDMVFCANQMFPFLNSKGKPSVLMSRMSTYEREAEVQWVRKWAIDKEFEIYELPLEVTFEGMGDAIWNYETQEIFFGHGFRSSQSVESVLKELTGCEVRALQLVSDKFYHLDTALSILSGDSAIWVPEAFHDASREIIRSCFSSLIEVEVGEAEVSLAANALCVGGKRVVIEKSATKTIGRLHEEGFEVYEVDTSEFIKAGGSVFCMKWLYSLLLMFCLTACGSAGVEKSGERTYTVRCKVDLSNCYDKAREVCFGTFDVRKTSSEGDDLEVYIQCNK